MATLDRTLKMGMVGGGPGAFIGDVHRRAALLDGGVELVAGAFASDRARSQEKGRELLLDAARVYGSLDEMVARELTLPMQGSGSTSSRSSPRTICTSRWRRPCWRRASTSSATSR